MPRRGEERVDRKSGPRRPGKPPLSSGFQSAQFRSAGRGYGDGVYGADNSYETDKGSVGRSRSEEAPVTPEERERQTVSGYRYRGGK
jgi:hypothetical protein